jgi:hypothetical protein
MILQNDFWSWLVQLSRNCRRLNSGEEVLWSEGASLVVALFHYFYNIINSVEHSHCEANSFSASQEFSAFYGTGICISACTRACILSLPWVVLIYSILAHPI